jgi:NADH-quinone oxidoreductase subunit J
MDPHPFLFYTLAGLTGASALAVVVSQNIVRAAAWLLFALAGTAGVFFLLGADFVGTTQLLVYVGGTLVLVVFGVMLTAQGPFINLKISAIEWGIATAVGLLFYGLLAVCLLARPLPEPPPGAPVQVTSAVIGQAFLGLDAAAPQPVPLPASRITRERTPMNYLLPFEIVSVHLLVVLIGAAYLARAKRRRGATTP